MKIKESYYVERGVPFDEQLLLVRCKNGVWEYNACLNDYPGVIGGWLLCRCDLDKVRIPTWQAKAYWPYIINS